MLTLAHLSLAHIPLRDRIEVAARAGFDGLGIRLLPAAPGEAASPLLDNPALVREIRRAVRGAGLAVSDIEIVRISGADRDWRRFLECAAELGGRHVLVAGDDRDWSRLVDGFARFAGLAAGFGLTADIEFMPWTAVPDLAAALRLLDEAACGNGGVLVDALHLHRAGNTPEDVAVLPAERIHYAQLCDAEAAFDPETEAMIAVARAARRVPGAGDLDLAGLVGALPKGCPISVEVPNARLSRELTPDDFAARLYAETLRIMSAGRSRALKPDVV